MLTVTQYNVTAKLGRPLDDAEVDRVFSDLAYLHPGIGFTDTAAELVLTVDDADDAAEAIGTVEGALGIIGLGAARQLVVETTADFDAAS